MLIWRGHQSGNSKMAKKKKSVSSDGLPPTADYRHAAKRTNIPSATMASEGDIPKTKRVKYAYSPHLDPVLRFDPTGNSDKVKELVEKVARKESLTAVEIEVLRGIAEHWSKPWLEWANKQEEHDRGQFSVDPVALHIHERISAQAIIRNALREDAERSLFGNPEQAYSEAVQFYKHDVDWANRLILGDSLQVMSSLAHRENLAGKVQMIYIDPPYGIGYGSNFQPEVGNRVVKQRDEDLSREPEMVRAYRDTWRLGLHSYLGYLRDRFVAAREVLTDEGSVFVQIGEDNLHSVRDLLTDVFGPENFIAILTYKSKKMPLGETFIFTVNDYVIWFSKKKTQARFNRLYTSRAQGEDTPYSLIMESTGAVRPALQSNIDNSSELCRTLDMRSTGRTETCVYDYNLGGRSFSPSGGRSWKTNSIGMERLQKANRLVSPGNSLQYVLMHKDYPVSEIPNVWMDTQGASEKRYVVQTTEEIIQRCMLMTTDPGDLVLDPTCGSGTTAFVAEEWGRRWITIDTSRVAISIARQRLLTSKFEHFRTKAGPQGALGAENPASGFKYKTVPHITLGAIAQNQNLDPIFAKHEPILAVALAAANNALSKVTASLCDKLKAKLAEKEKLEKKKSITDADRRRWLLPPANRDPKEKLTVDVSFKGWYDWEVPFDTDPDWPKDLQESVTNYRKAWRSKMDEVNACINANAEPEDLVDQPEVVKKVVRVSGPFTVEGVIPEELSITENGIVDLTPNEFEDETEVLEQQNVQAYLKGMVGAIKKDGVLFPNNKKRTFARVDPLIAEGTTNSLHAEAAWEGEDEATVGIAFGPQYGPVTAMQVEDLIRSARRYAHLVIAGFSFAPEASLIIQESKHPKLQIHMAHIRPDMNPGMNGLLKETPNSQLFTVFGLPAIEVHHKGDEFSVELKGVDIYDPVANVVRSTKAEKVAGWFLDSDFDGRCFCVCQAFFPDRDAWEKIAKALGASADADAFEAFRGTLSLPFEKGKHSQVAVKVIDPRGNEVMTVRKLEG